MADDSLAPVVAVLNMKGGVGKTTISAHVMRVLYHVHQVKTLLVDLDPQFNLSQALIARSRYDKLKEDNRTILAVMEPPPAASLYDIKTSTSAPPEADEISHRLRYFRGGEVSLDLLPGDFRLVKYSLIDNLSKLDLVKKSFLKFIGQARKHYDLVVIDCNPSSSFITSCALHASNHVLVPVRPDRYSVLGLEILDELVGLLPTIDPKPEFMVLLNGIPRQGYDSTVEDELRGHSKFGKMVLADRLPQSRILEAKTGYTGFATDKPVPYRHLLRREISRVVDEIVVRLGLT